MMFASLDLKAVIAFSQIEKIGFSEALKSSVYAMCSGLAFQASISPEAVSHTKLRLFCTKRRVIMFCAKSWFCCVAVFECHCHLL